MFGCQYVGSNVLAHIVLVCGYGHYMACCRLCCGHVMSRFSLEDKVRLYLAK